MRLDRSEDFKRWTGPDMPPEKTRQAQHPAAENHSEEVREKNTIYFNLFEAFSGIRSFIGQSTEKKH